MNYQFPKFNGCTVSLGMDDISIRSADQVLVSTLKRLISAFYIYIASNMNATLYICYQTIVYVMRDI